jgi:hypothetical protein
MKFLSQRMARKMKNKYEEMTFDELQEAYIREYITTKRFNGKVKSLKDAVASAATKYKELQAELMSFNEDSRIGGRVPEESFILEEIGRRIVLADPDTEDPDTEDPDTEAGPEGSIKSSSLKDEDQSRRRVKKDD